MTYVRMSHHGLVHLFDAQACAYTVGKIYFMYVCVYPHKARSHPTFLFLDSLFITLVPTWPYPSTSMAAPWNLSILRWAPSLKPLVQTSYSWTIISNPSMWQAELYPVYQLLMLLDLSIFSISIRSLLSFFSFLDIQLGSHSPSCQLLSWQYFQLPVPFFTTPWRKPPLWVNIMSTFSMLPARQKKSHTTEQSGYTMN